MSSDVIIIGSGVIGLSIAHTLIREGLSVILLDSGQPGRAASWASAGVLAPQGAQPQAGPYLDLSLKSRDLYDGFAQQLMEDSGIDIEYRGDGGLHIAVDDGEAEVLEARYQHQQKLGLPVERLEPKDVLSLEPALSPEVRVGLMFTGLHQVENRRLVQALTVAVGLQGGTFVTGAPVTALMIGKNKVSGVETPRGRFRGGIVINAAGAWAGQIGGSAAPSPPVKPVKGQMLALNVGTTTPIRRVIHGIGQYLVPRRDGRLLVGATVEKTGFDVCVTAGGITKLLNNAFRMAPSLDQASIMESWAGLRPKSKDGKPILGPAGVGGLVMAAGHFRNGILLAPITAKLIGEYVLNGGVSSEMTPYLLDRFHRKG